MGRNTAQSATDGCETMATGQWLRSSSYRNGRGQYDLMMCFLTSTQYKRFDALYCKLENPKLKSYFPCEMKWEVAMRFVQNAMGDLNDSWIRHIVKHIDLSLLRQVMKQKHPNKKLILEVMLRHTPSDKIAKQRKENVNFNPRYPGVRARLPRHIKLWN